MVSLRQRNKSNAMRLTQRTALPMFIEQGFDKVTVTAIAEEVGIAPSTIYRHFSTKEAIVLWDEHDADFETALVAELKQKPPLEALRTAFVEALGERYDADLDFQLERVSFIYETEALHAAAVEQDLTDREELADGLRHFLSKQHRDAAPILAGAAMVALDIAFDRWQQAQGSARLGDLIDAEFSRLAALGDIT